jgi:hypothetical protein
MAIPALLVVTAIAAAITLLVSGGTSNTTPAGTPGAPGVTTGPITVGPDVGIGNNGSSATSGNSTSSGPLSIGQPGGGSTIPAPANGTGIGVPGTSGSTAVSSGSAPPTASGSNPTTELTTK